jgi:hypothetical protein
MLTGMLPQTEPALPLTHGAIGIAGGAPGINAAVELDVEAGNVVIVLANYSPPAAQEVSKSIRGLMKRVKWEK